MNQNNLFYHIFYFSNLYIIAKIILVTNNKLVFGIGKILVLMTTVFLTVPSKVAIAQQQDEEMNKMQMSKEMMQNMIEEEISKK